LRSSHSRMAAKAAENPAAGSRTVTIRIDDPPDVCSRTQGEKKLPTLTPLGSAKPWPSRTHSRNLAKNGPR
jgi:hypothetical protein